MASARPFFLSSLSNPSKTPTDTIITIPGEDHASHHLSHHPSRQVVIEIPPVISEIDTTPPIKGLLTAVCSQQFLRMLADKTGWFNVTQLALELPAALCGVSGKYGVQVNIVRSNSYPRAAEYYLQLFPIHDEIGFDLQQVALSCPPENFLPEWCSLSAQIVRNHEFNTPLFHTVQGWTMAVRKAAPNIWRNG